MTQLSILIPARNEMWLGRTVEGLLNAIRADTEVIVVHDGATGNPALPKDDRLHEVLFGVSVGQRAATNAAAGIAQGTYLMKLDAHCAVDEGFDAKLLADMQPDWTVVPTMRNLHAFDWVCAKGHRRYQSRSGPCTNLTPWLKDCMAAQGWSIAALSTALKVRGSTVEQWLSAQDDPNEKLRRALYELFGSEPAMCAGPTQMETVWIPKRSPQSNAYCFDSTPHFQYFREFNKRPEGKGPLTESMSLQGSCWMLSREKYFSLNVCDEAFGSWGSQGIEVACKTWLSGGRVIVNHNTWYAHLFRTQGGDFGFPYELSGNQIDRAKQKARELFFEGQWDKAIYPLAWLLEKFWPVPGWTQEELCQLKALSTTPA